MIPLELSAVAPLGRLETRPWADAVTGVQIDSRRISEGDLFVAVHSGADFVKHAFARGAAAALVPEDAHAALAELGRAVRGRSGARVVGITGSTGKTSTKDILNALTARHARTVATEASYNAELGVPLTLCRLEADTEICIVEMGMRGLGQIEALCELARPEIGVITSVAPVHLELLGTLENVARSKAELVASLPSGGVGIVPDDAPALEPFLRRDDVELRRFGRPESWEPEDGGARGVFAVGGRRVTLHVNLAPRHHGRNVLAALQALDALGLPLEDGELRVELSHWRGEELDLPDGVLVINDAYNANPLSMRAALDHLTERANGRRRVAVLGDMAELGPDAAAYHREIGDVLAARGVEEVIAVGELAAAYLEGGARGQTAADPGEATELLRAVLRPGDVVLVKGSRAVGLEAVAQNLIH